MAIKQVAHREQPGLPTMDHSHIRSQTTAALTAAEPHAPTSGIRALIRRRPVAAYVIMTTTGAWLGLLPVLFLNATLSIPYRMIFSILVLALPAFLVTAIADGRAGVRDLLARALRWRVGLRWYALALLGLPVGMLLLATTVLGTAPLATLIDKWSLLFTMFVPDVLIAVVTVQLFEELGWTGSVQQRLQGRHRALPASLLVALAFTLWHVPNYLVEAPVTGEQVLLVLVKLVPLAIFAVFFRVLITWLYNGAGRSALIAALVYAVLNAVDDGKLASEFVPQSVTTWLPLAAVAVLAVLGGVATRGRLAYRPDDGSTEARRRVPAATLPTRPTLG
jgi:uncharacterized protein